MDQKTDDYTSRKFILALISIALVSIGFFQGRVPVLYWLTFLGVTFLGYGALNILGALLNINKILPTGGTDGTAKS